MKTIDNGAIKDTAVKIDGIEYPVNHRTKRIDELLTEYNDHKSDLSEYEKNFELMTIMLGEEAAKKIFPNDENEDLDRMSSITRQVYREFNAAKEKLNDDETDRAFSDLEKVANRMRPSIELAYKAKDIAKVK